MDRAPFRTWSGLADFDTIFRSQQTPRAVGIVATHNQGRDKSGTLILYRVRVYLLMVSKKKSTGADMNELAAFLEADAPR